ncbi:MAG: polysaccharide biosynthesis C-terminal domain-containing protein, partial [Lentisphaeria bacterium]|nr:polysaccharide biosynthesis C-terminal domain-containing protein [Lentisphaeria bacterium]
MAVGKNTIDMTRGPLFFNILRFCVPLTLSFLLQLAFNAADMMVIGRWGNAQSLAAIGASTFILTLMTNAITGLSTGANMLAAQYFGARDSQRMTRLVHTTIALSIAGGVACGVLGLILVKWLVEITDVPEAVRDKSILYLSICFLGIPFQILYNFGYAILRAIGNSKSPLYYLIYSGIVNVLLNLFMVVVCKTDVAG